MIKTKDTAIVPVEHIARSILILRGIACCSMPSWLRSMA